MNQEDLTKLTLNTNEVKQHQAVVDCYNMMVADADHGRTWKAEDLARVLETDVNSIEFPFRLSAVKRMLEERKGFHLTSRGKSGTAYFIEDVTQSVTTIKKMGKNALDLLERATKYGVAVLNQHGHKLDANEKYKLQKQIEIEAKRLLFAQSVKSTIKKSAA